MFLSCISSLLLAMDPPATTNNSERTKAALQLLKDLDLSHYKTIACYDYNSDEIVKTLASHMPDTQFYGINPDTQPKPILISIHASLLLRISNSFRRIPTPIETIQEGYDLIFSSFALLFNHARESAIDSLHVQLKTGGHLVMRGLSAICPNDALNVTIAKMSHQKKWETVLKEFTLSNYEFSFTQAKKVLPSDKWRNLSTQAESVSITFHNKDALRQWISHWIDEFPFNPPLFMPEKQELASDFTNEYLPLFGLSYSGANISIEAYKK